MKQLLITLSLTVDNDDYSALVNQKQSGLTVATLMGYVIEHDPSLIQDVSVSVILPNCK